MQLKYFLLGLLLCLTMTTHAQEINCLVTLNSDQLYAQQTTDANVMAQLKAAITDFMNTRRWTNDNFEPEEKINCKLNINLIRSSGQGNYEGNAQFIVTRPVFGTNYETVTFNYVDRFFNFSYLPSNPMYFNENNFSDDLTHTLAFYAYMALVFDYDAFQNKGGDIYLQKAFTLTNVAQSMSGSAGWKSSDTRSRYWLVENLMNPQMMPLREAMYGYHRLGLDAFAENPVQGRKKIIEALNAAKQANQLKPGSALINTFFDAKGEEIYKILKEATKEERRRAFDTLSQLDPAKTEMYRRLLQ